MPAEQHKIIVHKITFASVEVRLYIQVTPSPILTVLAVLPFAVHTSPRSLYCGRLSLSGTQTEVPSFTGVNRSRGSMAACGYFKTSAERLSVHSQPTDRENRGKRIFYSN